MLKLVLDPVNKLTDEEMRKGGKAKITFATGVEAEGTFKCFRAGVGINACITARGNFAADSVKNKTFVKDGDSAASARLWMSDDTAVTVPTGTTAADGFLTEIEVDSTDNVEVPDGWTATVNENGKLVLKPSANLTADTNVLVQLNVKEVATGHFVDPNCNHPLVINPVGAVHIDACCQLKRLAGLKPNDHSFSIHVKDDPHAVVFSIASEDEFDPKEA